MIDKASKENKLSVAKHYGDKEPTIAIIIPGSIDVKTVEEKDENDTGLRKVLD
jgi:hypothetical protein